jgi:large subunit ribosomal protein L22
MEAKAIAKTVRVTPRKARLVLDLIRGRDVKEAEAILKLTPKGACEPVLKVLKSATANAEHNLDLKKENLFVKECYANDSIRMKRMLPRAKGRGDVIQKRTCHITVVVAEKE